MLHRLLFKSCFTVSHCRRGRTRSGELLKQVSIMTTGKFDMELVRIKKYIQNIILQFCHGQETCPLHCSPFLPIVEKVTAITRFLEPNVVHHSSAVQSSMANVFSYLISSLDDLNPHVAQRATLFLDNLQSSSLKCLSWCLEAQFDMVILDRPVILQTLYQLYSCLPDRSVLSWDFFLNRFDTLFLEAQVNLEKSGDIVCPRGE